MNCEIKKFKDLVACYGQEGFLTSDECNASYDWKKGSKKDTPTTAKKIIYLAKPTTRKDPSGRRLEGALLVTLLEKPENDELFISAQGVTYKIVDGSIYEYRDFGFTFKAIRK